MYRVYIHSDSKHLVQLLNQLGYPLTESEIHKRVQHIRAAGGEVFIAEYHGAVVGCINAILDVRLAEGVVGEIVSLVVDSNHRGLGLGKGLIEVAENWLSASTEKIRIRANAIRTESHGFYLELGYEEFKTQKVFIKKL